ncbi:MAG: FAD-binding domain-containing protein, partial [Paracoccaceae bacterium]
CPQGDDWRRSGPAVLLVTEDDMSPEFLLDQGLRPLDIALVTTATDRSPLLIAPQISAFVSAGLRDAATRLGHPDAPVVENDPIAVLKWAKDSGATQIVTPYAPTGPVQRRLAQISDLLATEGITLNCVMRAHDRTSWPHATQGFFRFRAEVMG